MDFNTRLKQYLENRRALDTAVLRDEENPPPCFTCKAPSTFVTTGITPAGYRAYQCANHVPKSKKPLWGADPGWHDEYISIEEARDREAARMHRAAAKL